MSTALNLLGVTSDISTVAVFVVVEIIWDLKMVFMLYVCMSSRPAMASARLPVQWVPGAPSPGGRAAGREAGHSPSNPEIKNGGAIPLLFRMSSWHST
jgi:hypothetical protein